MYRQQTQTASCIAAYVCQYRKIKLALLFEQQSSSEFYYYAHDNALNPLMPYELFSSFYGNGVYFFLLRCDAA